MNGMEKTLSDLLNMLKTAEQDMKNSKPMMLVDATPRRGKGKGKGKAKSKPKSKCKSQDALKPIGGVSKDGNVVCFYCGKPGHWKKHCKAFIASKKKTVGSLSKGIVAEYITSLRGGRPMCWELS